MKRYRVMIPDTFYDVDAESEEEAEKKAVEIHKAEADLHVIAYEITDQPESETEAGI